MWGELADGRRKPAGAISFTRESTPAGLRRPSAETGLLLFHNERERVYNGALAKMDAEDLAAIIGQHLRFRAFEARARAPL